MTVSNQMADDTGKRSDRYCFQLGSIDMQACADGTLWLPDAGVLVVSDLHLEKGSSFADRGRMLPPYDTPATLARLAAATARLNPDTVISLGDSFHDDEAPERLGARNADRLSAIIHGRRWIWITGNHDPRETLPFGGEVRPAITIGNMTFRHRPDQGTDPTPGAGLIGGHFHPKTRVKTRLARFSGRCFVHDDRRLVMPAFGAFTGGLDIHDPAIRSLFPKGGRAVALIRNRTIALTYDP